MPERTDTVEYTADELAEARRIVEQMVTFRDATADLEAALSDPTMAAKVAEVRGEMQAAEQHRCEPRWWPHKLGETWTCDCGHQYVCDIAANMGGVSAKAIRLGLLDPHTLGWRTV